MRLLRRRINTFFALQAILLFLSGLRVLLDPKFLRVPIHHWLFLSGYLLLSLVFLKAWRVTRKPSPHQESWARAAAVISILASLYLLWVAHVTQTFAVPAITTFLIGIATFFLLFQSRKEAQNRKTSPPPASTPANISAD